MTVGTRWALSYAPNPAVLRLDTTSELTRGTIETSPPSTAPAPLDQLLRLVWIRSIDLHGYRARLNLSPGADAGSIGRKAGAVLAEAWGPASPLRSEPARGYPVPYRGARTVAESLQMAGSQPILRGLFALPGVVEAILEPGLVRITLGPLFAWADVGAAIDEVVRGTDFTH
jgi:hypothetical protein